MLETCAARAGRSGRREAKGDLADHALRERTENGGEQGRERELAAAAQRQKSKRES